MDLLRSYQGVPFENLQFQIVEKTFSQSYASSIARYRGEKFVKFYPAAGAALEKTFGQFDEDVQKTLKFLLKNHRSASVIATKSQNSYVHIVYICAILLAGFQFCPLNPNDPEQRTQKKLAQLPVETVLLSHLEIPEREESDTGPVKIRNKQSPFILVFTSGSTGYSKVVEQTEEAVMTNVEALARHHHFNIGSQIKLATPLPLFHVNALEFSFFTTLLTGQNLVLFETFDLLQVMRSLQEDQIHILSIVPHLLFLLGQQIEKLKRLSLPNFRYFVTAAAPLPLSTLEKFCLSGLKVIQGYGLSEAVNFSLVTPTDLSCEKILNLAQKFNRPSAGIPIWGNEVFVLSPEMSPVSEGEIADIYIRGSNVMRGYRDEDSSKIFIAGLMKTSDLGFWYLDPETNHRFFFIAGRKKDIAKKNGTTVSLVEMDEILIPFLPMGTDAIAVAFEDARLGEELAIVFHQVPHDFDIQNFNEQIKTEFGREMLPKVFLFTNEKLRTESGKALRWVFQLKIQEWYSAQKSSVELLIWDLR